MQRKKTLNVHTWANHYGEKDFLCSFNNQILKCGFKAQPLAQMRKMWCCGSSHFWSGPAKLQLNDHVSKALSELTEWFQNDQSSTHRSPQKTSLLVVSFQLSVFFFFFFSEAKKETKQIRDVLLKTQNLQFSINGWCLSQNRANKKQENRPHTNSNPLKTVFPPAPNLSFWPFSSLFYSVRSFRPLCCLLTRTLRSPPSCPRRTAAPGSPSRTVRNWSGPPAALGAQSLWQCKQTRQRWTAGSRQSPRCPRPGPTGSRLCQPELLRL